MQYNFFKLALPHLQNEAKNNSYICLMYFLLLHNLSCLEAIHSGMLLTTNSETS